MQPKILNNLPPVPMPRAKPQLPPGMPPPVPMGAEAQGAPGMPPPVPMGDPKEESLRQTILNAIMKKNPDLMNAQEPGAMGAEGAAGMPPDQPPMDADAMMPPGPPGAPGASGLAPLPPPGPNPMSVGNLPVSNEMLAGEDMGPPSPERQASMDAQLGGMDAQIAKNMANNKAIAQRLKASPQELQNVMPSAYTGSTPPPQPGSRQALIDMLLKGQGMQ